ncbi:hypothetical protein Ga0074812_15518 [Parafrankia irregularis]|uniref:Uncharacterized protein n=1 Tax=Parafrankia irregularis TaxID=795642 RepID=A0A0S4R2U2_9ACTN|nr:MULTISPECIES: hypothetical protein [Parafrankia]MBE3200403.1 hypothetical protein [Parafrankia sp. CH37]CUU61082.1 hypothetical protein Ga0074812_15518 [Parafrankia irregularis]
MASAHTTMRVTLEGLGEYEVPANNLRWNGFACPGFTLDQVREIAVDLHLSNLAIGSDDQETIIVGDDEIVTIHNTWSNDTETVEPNPRDGLYYVGGFRWTWEIVGE